MASFVMTVCLSADGVGSHGCRAIALSLAAA